MYIGCFLQSIADLDLLFVEVILDKFIKSFVITFTAAWEVVLLSLVAIATQIVVSRNNKLNMAIS